MIIIEYRNVELDDGLGRGIPLSSKRVVEPTMRE